MTKKHLHLHSLILLAAAFFMTAVLPSENPNNFIIIGNNYTIGALSNRSQIVYSKVFSDTEFHWTGPNIISRIEILNLGNEEIGEMYISNGLGTNTLQIIPTSLTPFAAVVVIRATPQDRTIGVDSPLAQLVHRFVEDSASLIKCMLYFSFSLSPLLLNSVTVTGLSPVTFNYTDPARGRILRVRALDRTTGIGANVSVQFGIGRRSNQLSLECTAPLAKVPINYTINIYAEPFQLSWSVVSAGQLTNSSQLIVTRNISAADFTASGQFAYKLAGYTFDFARFTDQTEAYVGGIRSVAFGESNTLLVANAVSRPANANMLYQLQLYGEPVATPDIVVGVLKATSELLDVHTIYENATRSSFALRTPYAIDRLEVRNERQQQQRTARDRVRVTLVAGEAGGRQVIVIFQSDAVLLFDFRIRIYGQL